MDIKSNEQIVSIIEKKIAMMLIEQLPTPSCPLKRQQNEWKVGEIKKALAAKLLS
jgi:hypothetical protein